MCSATAEFLFLRRRPITTLAQTAAVEFLSLTQGRNFTTESSNDRFRRLIQDLRLLGQESRELG